MNVKRTSFRLGPFVLLFTHSDGEQIAVGPFEDQDLAAKCAEKYPDESFVILPLRTTGSFVGYMSF